MSHSHESESGRCNPYEVTIFGPAGADRHALATAIFERLSKSREVAQLIDGGRRARGSGSANGSGEWSGPTESVFVKNQLLDADMVIYECTRRPNVPEVVVDSERPGLTPDDWIPIILKDIANKASRARVYGLLLAGGRSRRMRRDKAALRLHAQPQLHHAFALLSDTCDRAFISTRAGQENDKLFGDLPRVEDKITEIGPLGGIISAQMTHPQVAWLVLACDLPFVTAEVLAHLKSLRDPTRLATAFCSSRDGLPEPLCAIYEPKSHVRLLNFLAMGVRCPRKILLNSRTMLLELPDRDALANLNTPEDLDKARARLLSAEEFSA